jgi:hypothetical protein
LRLAERISTTLPKRDTRPAIDPVNSYHRRLLDCPEVLADFKRNRDTTRLDSACNYR